MAEGAQQIPADPAERVRAVLERVLVALDIDGDVAIDEDDDEIAANVDGDDLGILIGRRGQTIDAIQVLCYRVAYQGDAGEDRKRVSVDAAGYRERRREILERQADRAADSARKAGRPVDLEPMSAQERRIVHNHLAEVSGVETYSEGDEPERWVVVAPLVS